LQADLATTREGSAPAFFDVPVAGGDLKVARWGEADTVVFGIHGITASSMSLLSIARRLLPDLSLVAPDLRGRGGSNSLPGPFGFKAHAADCARVIEAISPGQPVVVLGESMGAYVAAVLAATRPDLVSAVVMADGGLIAPPIPGVDVDQMLEALLGPALARLRQVFADEAAYLDYWRAHPSLVGEWSDDLDAWFTYDLEPTEGGVKSRVHEDAVRIDGGQNYTDPDVLPDALRALKCPVTLIRATRNLLNVEPPLFTDELVDMWRPDLPQLVDEIVPDTNHYTIMFGTRGADTIARHVRQAVAGA
jgi:pimeloyl-ACP methyl ester carboxylesterase